MGYNSTADLIDQNLELVEQIYQKISHNETISFRIASGANIQTEHYRLRRVLSACDAFKRAHSGRYAGLGAKTTLRVNYDNNTIEARPKGGVALKTFRATEKDAVDFLIDQKGSMAMVEFWPSESYSDEAFFASALVAGWRVADESRVAENGKLTFVAERVDEESEKRGGFAALGGG